MSINRTFKGEWSKNVLINSAYPDEMKGLQIEEPNPQPVQIPQKQKITQIDDVLGGAPDISNLKITTLN